jgi:hypothetical protein
MRQYQSITSTSVRVALPALVQKHCTRVDLRQGGADMPARYKDCPEIGRLRAHRNKLLQILHNNPDFSAVTVKYYVHKAAAIWDEMQQYRITKKERTK